MLLKVNIEQLYDRDDQVTKILFPFALKKIASGLLCVKRIPALSTVILLINHMGLKELFSNTIERIRGIIKA